MRKPVGISLMVAITASAALAWISARAEAADPVPTLGGGIASTGGVVEVEVMAATAGIESRMFYDPRPPTSIASNHDTGIQMKVGPFLSGTALVFDISYETTVFMMGDGTLNADGIPHATDPWPAGAV